jgi:hypothetical protein
MTAIGKPLTVALFALCLTTACQHDVETPFAPGLKPVDLDAGVLLDAAAYTEQLNLQQGSDSTSNYVNATGYVLEPIETVWAAMQIPAVVVNRSGITSYTVTPNVEPQYTVSFATACVVDGIETVDFTLTWREGVVDGTDAGGPTAVSIDYQKTDGSSFISLMEGTIGLVAVTDSITEITFSQRMNAVDTSSSNIASWTQEIYASVLAQVKGEPLPN